MRRKMWTRWLCLGIVSAYDRSPRWRVLDTGEVAGLGVHDYLSPEWEVLP